MLIMLIHLKQPQGKFSKQLKAVWLQKTLLLLLSAHWVAHLTCCCLSSPLTPAKLNSKLKVVAYIYMYMKYVYFKNVRILRYLNFQGLR